jgi:RNA polymerase sigma factor (sigma-70 family)
MLESGCFRERVEEMPVTSSPPRVSWSDTRLVGECLKGNETAWAALIDKYKNLIFSIPVKRGFSREDATDIFQTVAAQLLSELARIREPEALAAWLMQVTSNKCTQWQRRQIRENGGGAAAVTLPVQPETAETPESLLAEARREQTLRYAVHRATPQCRRLINMLFYENPPLPYEDVAESLGIATGSVGFVRRKCLDRMRRFLQEAGFR